MATQTVHSKYIDEFLSEKQKESFEYFKENFNELYNNPLYRYKFVLISGKELLGIYDSHENAMRQAVIKRRPGEYIVQELIRDDEVVNFLYSAQAV